MTFSERVKPLKEKSKLTLSEIATACNISESMASRYINGQNIPPEDIARKMLDLLTAAIPTEQRQENAKAELQALRATYEEHLDDLRCNLADLKKQLHTERSEKWIFFGLFIAVIVFMFVLLCADITNSSIGWFRH